MNLAEKVENTKPGAIAALFSMNIIVALNQFNIASIYSPLASDFHLDVSGLGVVSALFFLGVAASEIPGSLLSMRFGSKKVLIVTSLLTSAAIAASGLAPTFLLVEISRLIAGIGIGAAFPPLVSLMLSNVRRNSSGMGVGLVSLSFNMGGIVGLFGWALIGVVLGWRTSLELSGLLGFLATAWCHFGLKELGPDAPRVRLGKREFTSILLDRKLTLVVLALFGISAASTVDWNFMVYYLEQGLDMAPGVAGLVGGAGLAFSIGAPLIGRLYDRDKNPRKWIILAACLTSSGVAVASLHALVFSLISVALVGVGTSTGYTVALAAAAAIGRAGSGNQSLAVGWTDSISLVGGFFSPIVFSFLVLEYGYSIAWLGGGLLGIVFLFPFLILGVQHKENNPRQP